MRILFENGSKTEFWGCQLISNKQAAVQITPSVTMNWTLSLWACRAGWAQSYQNTACCLSVFFKHSLTCQVGWVRVSQTVNNRSIALMEFQTLESIPVKPWCSMAKQRSLSVRTNNRFDRSPYTLLRSHIQCEWVRVRQKKTLKCWDWVLLLSWLQNGGMSSPLTSRQQKAYTPSGADWKVISFDSTSSNKMRNKK